MTIQAAYQYSIKLLTMRDYSCFKMRSKLLERNFSDLEVEEVIEKLVAQKYLNDENYKRSRVKQLLLKSKSNNFIIQKCAQEELYPNDEFIDNLRDEFNLSSDEIVRSLIEKKLKSLSYADSFEDRKKAKAKVFNFLKSKGHNSIHYLELIEKHL